MKTTIRVLAAAALVIFIWYLIADRVTPFTANARVKAVVVSIVPQVSGYVTALAVTNGTIVEAGDLLAKIDERPFQLAIDRAKADLRIASQEVGASSAGVELAQANVARATTELENTRIQGERIFELERRGVVAAARADDARGKLATAESSLAAANAELERARETLGAEGGENPKIQAAVADLGDAELALGWTELTAPSRGAVVNLDIDEGAYAKAGQPLMTFVSGTEVWIEAYLTENNLGRVEVGDSAEVVLDIHPGRVLQGVVASYGGGVSVGGEARAGDLPRPPSASGWMRDPQRFPLRIRLPEYEVGDEYDDVRYQVNGQADVIVYTSDNAVINVIGRGWIRLMSVLSYAY